MTEEREVLSDKNRVCFHKKNDFLCRNAVHRSNRTIKNCQNLRQIIQTHMNCMYIYTNTKSMITHINTHTHTHIQVYIYKLFNQH